MVSNLRQPGQPEDNNNNIKESYKVVLVVFSCLGCCLFVLCLIVKE